MEEIEGDKFVQVDENTIILRSNSSEMQPRLTPTGKISYAKTRVYTQRYRKEWEYMSDFKGWLTSVPHEPTRAFCKFCKKDLHAHRLSLLKHMCTMKHQRSALMHHNAMLGKRKEAIKNSIEFNEEDFSEVEDDREEEEDEGGIEAVEYTVEEELEIGETNFPEHKYARDVSEEEVEQRTRHRSIKMENAHTRYDKLAEAMAHVHGETTEENVEHIQLNMDVVSETVETSELSEEINQHFPENQSLSLVSLESTEADPQSFENEQGHQGIEFVDTGRSRPTIKKIAVSAGNTMTPANSKTIFLRGGSKVVNSGKVASGAQYVFIKGKPHIINERKSSQVSIAPKPADNQSSQGEEASTSQAKKMIKVGKFSEYSATKKPTISTHVLDMGKGLPIGGLQVSLYKLLDGRWTFVNESNTSISGRCVDLINSEKNALTTGRYKLHFDVDKYFSLRKIETLYPFIEIVFDVKNTVISYHIPILLSPFGYTTYRGTDR